MIVSNLPAANIPAEEATIGSGFFDRGIWLAIRQVVDEEHFADPTIGRYVTALDTFYAEHEHFDPLLFRPHLGDDFDPLLFARLMQAVPGPTNGAHYATQVKDAWRKRRAASVASGIAIQAANGVDTQTMLRGALRDFGALAEDSGLSRGLAPVNVVNLATAHPHLNPIVVDGWLRLEEVANLIAASKVGKSWLVYGLLLSIVMGVRWLDVFLCAPSRVLLLDAELHPSVLAHRIRTVAEAMGVTLEDIRDWFDIVSLRGRQLDIFSLGQVLDGIKHGTYGVIVVDALYRFYPPGYNENDNAAACALYNQLDAYAKRLGCAIICVHHSSKGLQSGKAVVDVGSGASSQARAVDSHLVLRAHEEPNCAVLEGAVRSFPPIEPLALRWSFPLWSIDQCLDPAELKGLKGKNEERQASRDADGKSAILGLLSTGPRTKTWISKNGGPSPGRTERLLSMLIAEGLVTSFEGEASGNDCTLYQINERKTEGV
ncbi:MAG: AAA family ATPase [Pirellulales bacterium]|nr:AAA family ATPase [Pirellulales bacterium]